MTPTEIPPRASESIPVVTRDPLVVFTLPWQIRPPRDSRTIILKATFDIVPGGPATIRREPEPPSGDVLAEDDPGAGSRSVKHPSDFALFKPRADVTLKGRGASKRPYSQATEARFRFGRSPNGFDHKSSSDAPAPACFGALPMMSDERWSKLGTHDALWQKTRWPYFPEDFDWTFFQSAPLAQRLDYLKGDEPFEIDGMRAERPSIAGRLPQVRPRCFTQRTTAAGGDLVEVALRLDTAAFDIDEMKLTLVWRSVIEVSDDDASEIAEIFALLEAIRAKEASLVEIRETYRALKVPLDAVGEDPHAPRPENDGGAASDDEMGAHTVELRAKLAAAGLTLGAGTAAATHLPPPAPPPPRVVEPRDGAIRKRVLAILEANGPLNELDLAGADLSDLDFSSRSLAGVNLKDARLCGCRFKGSNLIEAQMAGSDLTDAILDGADLERADLTGAVLEGASLEGATLTDSDFSRARGARASFKDAKGARALFAHGEWQRSRFDRAALEAADFTGAKVDEAIFDGADIPQARFNDARGSRASFDEANLTGARASAARFIESSFKEVSAPGSQWEKAILDGSTFVGAALQSASFTRASCVKVIFSGADISEGRLGRAKLVGASFLRANLMAASLEGADLTGADLRGSNLHGAETWKAKLHRADLDLAITTQTKLRDRA